MKNILTKLTIIFFFILIFIKKDIMYYTIYTTTLIWFKNIVPNLLPMFIITSLIVSSGLIFNICKFLGKPFKYIFKTSIYGIYIFILSLFTGCPSNAKYLLDLENNNLITPEERNKLLLFSINYNPILITSLLSTFLPQNKAYTILFIIIISNIVVGLLYRNKPCTILKNTKITKSINLSLIIKDTIDTLLMILGTLIVFNLIINLLPINNLLIKNILNGFLEITTGLKGLNYLNISENIKIILSLIYLSFGGISIHMQIKSILPDTNYTELLKTRILCAITTISLYLLSHSMGSL